LVGHRPARRLVRRVALMPERRDGQIKGRREVLRARLLDRLQEDRGEPERRVRELAFRRGERGHREEGAIYETVRVDEDQTLGPLGPAGPAAPAAPDGPALAIPRARSLCTCSGCGASAGAAAPPLEVWVKLVVRAEAIKRKSAAPLPMVASVRSGASQIGTATRGTSERAGTGDGSAAMSRAVARSCARRVRHESHAARCDSTAARRPPSSSPSR